MSSVLQNPPKKTTAVKFARKTSSGRYVSLSREDMDSMKYTVQHPPTPDNQPMSNEEDSAPQELPYGGIPRPNTASKMAEQEMSRSQSQTIMARGSACAASGCDGIAMQDGHGYDVHPL